jgi:hypothetical protein
MSEADDTQFNASAYKVPEGFPGLLNDYVQEVIRFNPPDIAAFSAQYFDAIAEGTLDDFLASWTKNQPYIPFRHQEPEVTTISHSDADYLNSFNKHAKTPTESKQQQ